MNYRNFSPFPNLHTTRLYLRAISPADAPTIFAMHSDKENRKFLDNPLATSIEDAISFIEKIRLGVKNNEFIYWGICSNENHAQLIGTICIWNFSNKIAKAEIGFELLPEYQGEGYMIETLEEVVRFGFEALNLKLMEAYTNSKNEKAIELLKKATFEKINVFNEEHSSKKYYYSMSIYRIQR